MHKLCLVEIGCWSNALERVKSVSQIAEYLSLVLDKINFIDKVER